MSLFFIDCVAFNAHLEVTGEGKKKKMETAETMAYKWPEKNISVEKKVSVLTASAFNTCLYTCLKNSYSPITIIPTESQVALGSSALHYVSTARTLSTWEQATEDISNTQKKGSSHNTHI